MSQDLTTLILKFETLKRAIDSEAGAIATSVSLTAKALAERTIKDKGFGESYSLREVSTFKLKGKELNARGKKYLEKRDKTTGVSSWKDFRQAQGLQVGFVDLSYSNKMWAGMFPRKPIKIGTFVVAPLAHNNKDGQFKMNSNQKIFGNFIEKALSLGNNRTLLEQTAVNEIFRIVKKNLDNV